MSRNRRLTFLLAVFLLGLPVLATTISWTGGSANWSPGNWNPSLPGSGDDVQIASGVAGGDNVFLNINTTINSLLLGNTNGSTLQTTTTQTLTINSSLTINNAGTLDFASASTLNVNGAVTNTVNVGGVLEFTGGSTLNMTGSLNNFGTVVTNPFNANTAANLLNVNGTFTNEAGALLNIGQNDTTADVANIGTFSNSGSVRVGHGAALNLTSALGSTSIVSGASYLINGSFNQGAGTNNALGSVNAISGSLTIGNGASQSITPTGGTLTVNSTGLLDLQSTQAWGGTTLTINGNVTNAGFAGTNVTNNENGTVASTLTVTGTFTNQSGATLNVGNNDDTIDVANIGTLSNSGFVRVGHGAALNLTNPLSSTSIVSGESYLINGNFNQGAGTNNALGSVNTISGSLTIGNGATQSITPAGGTLTVNSTGLLDLQSTQAWGGTTLTINGNVTNAGFAGTNVTNNENGTVASTLTVTGTFTNQAGATLNVGNNDDTIDVANIGTLSNSGFVRVGHGAALNLTNPLGSTSIVSGEAYLINGSFNQGAGTNNALGVLNTISGSLTIGNGASQSITPAGGTLTVNSTGLLDLQSTQTWGGTTLTINGNVTNTGVVETNITNGENGTVASTLTVTGTLTNQAGATLNVGNNDNTIDVANVGTLSNSGAVRIGHGAAVDLTNALSTTIVSGASYVVNGSFNQGAGTNNALGSLNTISGSLQIGNGASQAITPAGGTLTVNSTGSLDLQSLAVWGNTTLTLNGNVVNAGLVGTDTTNIANTGSTLVVTGTFTNQAGATLDDGHNNDTADVVTVTTLSNAGTVLVRNLATLSAHEFDNSGTATVNPGSFSPGGLFFVGTGTPSGSGYVQDAGGVLGEDLSSGTSFGVINVIGNVSLAGTLNVALLNGFDPAAGNPSAHFIFLTYTGTLSGTFNFPNPLFDNGTQQWLVTYDTADKDVFLSFQPAGVPEPASLVLTAGGLLTLAFARRRKRSRR